jgi:hypothetical protein
MSLLNVRLPGLLPRVECIDALITCMVMDEASLMYSLALPMSQSGSPCNKILGMFLTVWCILSHTALD